jgi:hypothetical protein
MDPPVSLPTAPSARPAATATAEPLEEPPEQCPARHGFRAGQCDGAFIQDLNARWCPSCPKPQHNPGAGALMQAQLWYRDPQSTSNQSSSMSNAIEFTICP